MSGPNMMQNASGFSLVGGQVVLGNVHNGSTPGVHAQSSIPPPPTWGDSLSESENYRSQLLRQKRGYPLYIPDPQMLPAEYRVHGVQIGDVGSVTSDGEFDFYFNIFLPAEHPINVHRTPANFTPMQPYVAEDVFHRNYSPGDYLSTSTVKKVDLDFPAGVFPGGHFVFNCDGPQGAVLALPDGSLVQQLRNVENMRTYAAKYADSWYEYINGPRGRGLMNGDLYLVTGCEKTRSWGMASYHTVDEQFRLFFKPTTVAGGATYNPYCWCGIHGQTNPSRRKSHDPPFTNDPGNQTTFIHGWSISLPTGLWGRLFGKVQTVPIVDFQSLLHPPGGFSAAGSQGSLVSWAFDFFAGRGESKGKQHADGDAVLSDLAPHSMVFNPAKLINEYILYKTPQGTGAVMAHDNDWCNILGDDSDLRLSNFLRRIDDEFNVVQKDGATFVVPKLQSPTPELPSLLSGAEKSRARLEGQNQSDGETTVTDFAGALQQEMVHRSEQVPAHQVTVHSTTRIADSSSSALPSQWWFAVETGDAELVKQLIEHVTDIDADNGRALSSASRSGRTDIVKLLLAGGADVNANGGDALRAASGTGRALVVKLLIENGADPNADRGHALWTAAWNGRAEVVELLIKHGADVNADDGQALWAAEENGCAEVAELLIAAGADVTVRGGHALRAASENEHAAVVELLTEANAKYGYGDLSHPKTPAQPRC
ncbi:hypothetical protein DFH06DRAFT_328593 [Mycena polygramma]|nr:hypothetical protein DFH06DRAFT_328593 [Mycena polygramma]